MFTSEIIYEGNLRTRATHLKSGLEVITDAPTDNQGKGEAFSPSDLTATSLGCCMVTLMGISARGHGINIDGTKVSVRKHMAANPRRISKIDVIIEVSNKTLDEKQRKILETAALTCPVTLSLHPDIEQHVEFIY